MESDITLLVVEDDALILDMVETTLSDAGFGVMGIANGTRALKELTTDATRFRAIITDIKLGNGPTGWDVARQARELVAHIPVIYMSGDSSSDWTSQGVPNSVILSKPFVPAQMVTAVTTLLNDQDTQRGSGQKPDEP